MENLSLKFSGAFICAIFISSAGLNVYFFTKSNSNDLKDIRGSTSEGRIGGAEDCLLSEVDDCDDWQDTADDLLCDNDGDAEAIRDGLVDLDDSVQWVVYTTTEHAAWHFKRGTVYYPGKMCGYNMIVWRGTTASSGDCDIINGQAVVDWNINNHPDSSAHDLVKYMIDSDFDLDFYRLVDQVLIVGDGLDGDWASYVVPSCSAGSNPRAYLYLYD